LRSPQQLLNVSDQVGEFHPQALGNGYQRVESNFPLATFQVRQVNLPNAAMLGKINLPPSLLLPDRSDSLTQPDVDTACHPSRIEVILGAYLSYAIRASALGSDKPRDAG